MLFTGVFADSDQIFDLIAEMLPDATDIEDSGYFDDFDLYLIADESYGTLDC